MGRFRNALLNFLIQLHMLVIRNFSWKPFIKKTYDPQVTQNKLLQQIIRNNKNTRYGKKHGFESITNYQQFQKAIPVHTYDDLSPYIKDQDVKKETAIHTEHPILFSVTSGTTGKPKYIPIFTSTVSQFKKSQSLFSYAQYEGIPTIYKEKILGIGSPVIEGTLDSDTPYGSVSGLLLKSVPYFIRCKYLIPHEIFEIEDYQLKYFLICAFSLRERKISFISSANPSTFLKIMDVIKNDMQDLVNFLNTGKVPNIVINDHSYQPMINRIFKPDPKRANELKAFIGHESELTFQALWPNLQAVATWMGGSCKLLIPKLRTLLSPKTKIIELGYLSSEFRGTLVVDVVNNVCIPTLHENFFEFVELEDWDNSNPCFHTLDQIESGKQYYIIVTTQNCLYRYFMNDIIQVTGVYNKTPTIEFVQKGKGITNITGEKLSESQLIEALDRVKKELEAPFDFFIMLADPEEMQYTLYIETPSQSSLAKNLEVELSRLNIEFETKRKSGRLNQTRVIFLKQGAGEEYKKYSIANKQREGQFKIVRLQYTNDCTFNFLPFQIEK
ncbi:MAG: GH3 auxin-responsive promoter family protein [Nitrospinota bacterium]|nr:GH3 auxin-responsive promoter family protein [Nitrospinota bacterium]